MKNKEVVEETLIGNEIFSTDKKRVLPVKINLSNTKRLLLFMVGCFGLYIISLLAVLIMAMVPLAKVEKTGATDFLTYGFLTVALLGVLGSDVLIIRNEAKLYKFFVGIGFGLAVILIPAIYDTIINLFYPHGVNANEAGLRSFIPAYPYLSIIFLCILGPMCEELTYRVGLFGLLRKKKWVAYLASILVFAFMHFDFTSKDMITELVNLPSYMISALIFAYAYDKFGFTTSWTAHMMNNLFAVVSILAFTK